MAPRRFCAGPRRRPSGTRLAETPHMRTAPFLIAALLCSCTGPGGSDGKPCSVADNGDGTATITCPDGTKVTVTRGSNGTNGTNGADGSNGVDGTSCTVTANPDAGTKTISCTDGTSVTVTDGQNGQNGTDANGVVDFTKLTAF